MKVIIGALSWCLLAPAIVWAQTTPAVPSKAQVAAQVRKALLDLASMKSGGKLLPSDEEAKLDALLLKATLLNANLEKPQIDADKLSELANELSDLEKDVGALKALVR